MATKNQAKNPEDKVGDKDVLDRINELAREEH